MITWHIGKKIEKQIIPARDGEKEVILSSYYEGTEHGHDLHQIEMSINSDGSLVFYNYESGDHIYLYPEQIEHLKELLNSSNKQDLD